MINRGVLFDLDGVLVDTEPTYSIFWQNIDRIYPTGIEDFASFIKGTTLPSILKHFPTEEIRNDIVKRLFEYQDAMQFELYPGAMELLDGLKAMNIPVAKVSSSDERKMRQLFEQHPWMPQYVTAVIDASKVTKSKPDPQGYLLGAEAIGVDIKNCFVFEDSMQGLAAGRASGATVVGVATTYPREKIAPLCDKVINSVVEVSAQDVQSW